MIKKHSLMITWMLTLAGFAAGFAALLRLLDHRQPAFYVYAGLAAAVCAGWIAVSLRVVLFRRKLLRFLRCLLNNDYRFECGVSLGRNDEVSGLELLMRRLGQQLRAYDHLQSETISALNRSLDALYRHVSDGIILAHVDQRVFKLNPVVQGMFQVEQETITFDAIEKQPENRGFCALLDDAVRRSKVLVEGKVALQLPIRNSRLDLFVEIVPIKDQQEKVRLAMIFVTRV